jgi:hypothetical protein
MSIGDAMRALDLADDQIHKAGRNLLPNVEAGDFPPHLYMEVLRLREELRDLEAKIGEHVMAVAGETEHA